DEVDGNLRDQTFPIEFPMSTFRDTQVRPMNMTWEQIERKWAETIEQQEARRTELAGMPAQSAGAASPEDLARMRKHLEYEQKESARVKRALSAEAHGRPALALGGVFFVLVAFPVGVWFHRADYLSAFVSCFLPIVIIYYPLVLAGTNMAKEGRVPAFIAVWVADAATLFAGSVMLRRLF